MSNIKRVGQRLRDLPIEFEIPDLSSTEAVYWQLVLTYPVPGPDFETISWFLSVTEQDEIPREA